MKTLEEVLTADKGKMRYLLEGNNFERRDEFEKRIVLEDFHRKVMGEPLLSEEVMDRLLEESLRGYDDKSLLYLPEGIDIDDRKFTVSYNPNHEDYVATENPNPTQQNISFDMGFGKGVQVWSIFKRNKIDRRDKDDGNPLVYALKGGTDWHFKSKEDRKHITNRITVIIDNFNKTHQYGPTVVVPSGAGLNNFLAKIVQQRRPGTKIVNGVLSKMLADDVYNTTIKNDNFKKISNASINQLFSDNIKRMHRERKGLFTFHFVDKKIRSTISQTLKISDKDIYASDINNKDILIIDDVISRGNTIKEVVRLIETTFTPRSITVLTLFSKI